MADPAPTPTPTPTPTPAPDASWDFNALPEADRTFIAGKSFDLPRLLKSYRELETVHHQPDRWVRLPGKDATPEEVHQFQAKLGRPEKPEAYDFGDFKPPEGDTLVAEYRKAAHEHGLNGNQAKGLLSWWQKQGEAMEAQAQAVRDEQIAVKIAAEEQELRREWAQGYDQQVAYAKLAVKSLGLSEAMLDTLMESDQWGFGTSYRKLAAIGQALAEGKLPPTADAPQGSITPATAKVTLERKLADADFRAKYLAGNSEAVAEVTQLHRLINP